MRDDQFNHYTAEECQQAIELLKKRLRLLTNPGPEDVIKLKLIDLPFSIRTLNALYHANLRTVGDVIVYGADRLGYLRGIGPKSEVQIRSELSKRLKRPL